MRFRNSGEDFAMRESPPEQNCLKNTQYLSSVSGRIRRKNAIISKSLEAGDCDTAAELLMTINEDTAEIAAAWEREHPGQPPPD